MLTLGCFGYFDLQTKAWRMLNKRNIPNPNLRSQAAVERKPTLNNREDFRFPKTPYSEPSINVRKQAQANLVSNLHPHSAPSRNVKKQAQASLANFQLQPNRKPQHQGSLVNLLKEQKSTTSSTGSLNRKPKPKGIFSNPEDLEQKATPSMRTKLSELYKVVIFFVILYKVMSVS